MSKRIDSETRNMLLKKANGYDVEEKEITVNKNTGQKYIKIRTKHIPADLSAIKRIQELKYLGLW